MRGYCHVTSSFVNLIRLSPNPTVPYRYLSAYDDPQQHTTFKRSVCLCAQT